MQNNVLLKPREALQKMHTLDSRLHMNDGKYTEICCIKIMNFACNLLINPAVADPRHLDRTPSFAKNVRKILQETNAKLELILTEPSERNLFDLQTKIANSSLGGSADIVYSSWDTILENITKDGFYKDLYEETPKRFLIKAIKIGIPFAIFNVQFKGEDDEKYSHVKIDLYSANIENEDNRRSFIIWKGEDRENYDFFVNNFDAIRKNTGLCFEPEIKDLEAWSSQWKGIKKQCKRVE